jgi:hypothetical protein
LDDGFTFVQSEDGDHHIQAIFSQPAKYLLTVYAKRKSETGNYTSVLTYSFNSVAMKDPNACFPIIYEQYRSLNAHLYSPFEGQLEAGKSQMFRIRVPGAEAVAVVSNGLWTTLKKDNDTFEGNALIGTGKAEVFARVAGSKQFIGMLRYEGVQ